MISIFPVSPGILPGFANLVLVEAGGRAAGSGFVLLMGSRGLWVNGANLKVEPGRTHRHYWGSYKELAAKWGLHYCYAKDKALGLKCAFK